MYYFFMMEPVQDNVEQQPDENHTSYNANFETKNYQRYFYYFKEDEEKKARCRKCEQVTTRPNSSTSAMEYHLKKCNQLAWKAMKELRSASRSSSNASSSKKWADTDLRAIIMNENWLKVICLNLHPLNFTEQKGLNLVADSK
jgi:hypothetical protein